MTNRKNKWKVIEIYNIIFNNWLNFYTIFCAFYLLMESADEEERKCITPQIYENHYVAKENPP